MERHKAGEKCARPLGKTGKTGSRYKHLVPCYAQLEVKSPNSAQKELHNDLGASARHQNPGFFSVLLDETTGCLRQCRYVLRDRDTKFCSAFDQLLRTNDIQCLKLPSRSPNLNALAERWVRSVKEECLSKLILFGEEPLRRALKEFTTHYHEERNHQGKDNLLLVPSVSAGDARNRSSSNRLGGLLRFYGRVA